jgi:hypothetical protein
MDGWTDGSKEGSKEGKEGRRQGRKEVQKERREEGTHIKNGFAEGSDPSHSNKRLNSFTTVFFKCVCT